VDFAVEVLFTGAEEGGDRGRGRSRLCSLSSFVKEEVKFVEEEMGNDEEDDETVVEEEDEGAEVVEEEEEEEEVEVVEGEESRDSREG
jgi:hypothetical protein